LEDMFKLFDINNDGQIEIEEFKHALPTTHRNTIKEGPGQKNLKSIGDTSG
jgi:Ca2+-binding EF-hand superfamily protein